MRLSLTRTAGLLALSCAAVLGGAAGAQANGIVPPVAAFTYSPDPGIAGLPVTFDASLSYTIDPLVSIIAYSWDFNSDGVLDVTTSNDTVFTVFSAPGIYDVLLRVEDSNQLTDDTVGRVTILAASPVPEPASAALLAAGLLGLGVARRRRPATPIA